MPEASNPTSPVQICNSALTMVGAERISTLDDDSEEGRVCKEEYPKLKRILLAEHPWNFAIKRAELAKNATDPDFGFDSAFDLPSDNLRVIGTDLGSEDEWVKEGEQILCNYTTLKIRYISAVTLEAKFSWGFANALTHLLGVRLAYRLAQSTSLAESLKRDYIVALRNAKAQDAQEGSTQVIEANQWYNSRF